VRPPWEGLDETGNLDAVPQRVIEHCVEQTMAALDTDWMACFICDELLEEENAVIKHYDNFAHLSEQVLDKLRPDPEYRSTIVWSLELHIKASSFPHGDFLLGMTLPGK